MAFTLPHASGNQGDDGVPQQLSIAFEPGLVEQFRSLKDCFAHCVYRARGGVTAVAARLDIQPSHLSEALSGGGDRGRKVDLDWLEDYIAATGDTTPVLYLAARFLAAAGAEQAAAAAQARAILDQLPALLAKLGSGAPPKPRR